MDVPLQLAFHNIEKSDWAEEEIRRRVDKLSDFYGHVIGCRVTVDRRTGKPVGAVPPVVHIEISLPGVAPLVVAYEPERLQREYQSPTLGNAISHAFDIAERRLAKLKDARSGRPEGGELDLHNQFLGHVAELHPDRDHGFLMTKEGGLLYFHRNSMLSGSFDDLQRGAPVHYVEEVGDTGPIARKVRVVDE